MPSISDLRRCAEVRRLDFIRHSVDDACERIRSGQVPAAEARELAACLRFEVGLLIPDQMATYDLIYGARLARLTEQFAPPPSGPEGPTRARTPP